MPRTKTTNINKKVKEVQNVEVESIQPIETKPQVKRAVQIDRDRLVACKSVVYGKLVHVSPISKVETVWEDFGDVQWLAASEIVATPKKFLTKPWVLIEDYDELVEFLRLSEMYEKLIPMDNLEDFLSKPFNEIETFFTSAPRGLQQTFATKINEMALNGTLSDLRIVNMVDKTFGTGIKEFI